MLRLKTTEQRRLLEREQTSSESDCEAPAKLRPLHTVPPYLYKTETIQRFQNRVREAFLSGDRGRARVYLQSVVDHIVIGEDEIVIEAKAGAGLAVMAASRSAASESTSGHLPSRGYVVGMLLEQENTGRIATVRLTRDSERSVYIDLLFASSGIEPEIVAAAEELAVLEDVTVRVTSRAHLIAMKVLARDPGGFQRERAQASS